MLSISFLDKIETGVRTLSGLICVYVRADVEWEVLGVVVDLPVNV